MSSKFILVPSQSDVTWDAPRTTEELIIDEWRSRSSFEHHWRIKGVGKALQSRVQGYGSQYDEDKEPGYKSYVELGSQRPLDQVATANGRRHYWQQLCDRIAMQCMRS
ncbi:Hypothetical predicted protein [Olea europaea subsp. europaea]|uniref:Uncharacterized protein n=1 Tax=Olea europaea subsp. europaea TaxID=158383 RepID=A0A8S0S874_OLEEU|nr:Hypothetical predicted protein [Olea europaea subsp. europaea]